MSATPAHRPSRARSAGPGSTLLLLYGFFVLASGARSIVQIMTKFHLAPLAYTLSALASLVYLCAAVAIARAEWRPSAAARGLARRIAVLELCGVALVGVASLAISSAFPDATVWSGFGVGYGFVPVALPLLTLLWLHRAHTTMEIRKGANGGR